jgi:glycosyltransferase involved in cell wall biosynthesis
MAAGLPLVAQANDAVSELVENDHSALLCRQPEPWEITRGLTRLLEDRQLALRLKDAASRDAYTQFAPSQYRTSIRQTYEQVRVKSEQSRVAS